MIVKYRKKFLKDLSKVPLGIREKIEFVVFENIPQTKSFFEFESFEKMKGYSVFYKIRFGSYRVGVKFVNETVVFERVLHRKDIYKYFP